jgi:hypothetical protein
MTEIALPGASSGGTVGPETVRATVTCRSGFAGQVERRRTLLSDLCFDQVG